MSRHTPELCGKCLYRWALIVRNVTFRLHEGVFGPVRLEGQA